MTEPKYLSGKRTPSPYDEHWSKRHTRADVLEEEYHKANYDHRTFMERNSSRLIALCIVGLGVLGAAVWGWPMLVEVITSYVDMTP